MSSEWKAQYQHPLWQKKRLDALEASGWACADCGDKEMTLHVHHRRYVKGRKVWEYELAELEVLCAPCHEERHYLKDQVADLFTKPPIESQVELLQIGRGYINTTVGPLFGDDYAREVDREYYALGVLVGVLAMTRNTLKVEIAGAMLRAVKADMPRATQMHAELMKQVEWFRKAKDE